MNTPTDPAIAELLSFFDFAHLQERTPHLAAASEPFYRAAHALADTLTGPIEPETEAFTRMAFGLTEAMEDGSAEAREAAAKVSTVIREGATTGIYAWRQSLARWLRLLLEAKDCAVRAALVRHRAEAPKPVTGGGGGAGFEPGSILITSRKVGQGTIAANGGGGSAVEPVTVKLSTSGLVGPPMPTEQAPEGTRWVWCWSRDREERRGEGWRWWAIDEHVADVVQALQGRLPTKASCQGHRPGELPHVWLEDGRVLVLLPDMEALDLVQAALARFGVVETLTDPAKRDGLYSGTLAHRLAEPGTVDDPEACERAKASGPIAEQPGPVPGADRESPEWDPEVALTVALDPPGGFTPPTGPAEPGVVMFGEPEHVGDVREILARWQANGPDAPTDRQALLDVCKALGGVGEYDRAPGPPERE